MIAQRGYAMVSRMMKLIPSPLRRMITHIGRRGLFLLFWSFLWITTGLRWTVMYPTSDNYDLIYKVLAPNAWGYVFIGTGIIMGLGAFAKRMDPISYATSAWVASVLAVGVIFSWPDSTGWTIVGTYLAYTVLVLVISGWPEAPKKVE